MTNSDDLFIKYGIEEADLRAAGWMPESEHLAFIKAVRESQKRNQVELDSLVAEVKRLAHHFGVQERF